MDKGRSPALEVKGNLANPGPGGRPAVGVRPTGEVRRALRALSAQVTPCWRHTFGGKVGGAGFKQQV